MAETKKCGKCKLFKTEDCPELYHLHNEKPTAQTALTPTADPDKLSLSVPLGENAP